MLFNLPGFEQYQGSSSSAGIMGWLSPFKYLSAHSNLHRNFNWYVLGKDKKSFKASLVAMKGWDFTTIVPCHGEIIDQNAKSVWDNAFSHYFTKGAEL